MIDPRKDIVLSEESCRQSEQNYKFGKIAHHAQVQKAVCIVRLRTEAESAAFIGMDHEGREEKFRDDEGSLAVQINLTGYRLGSDQLFQGNAEISQFSQFQSV